MRGLLIAVGIALAAVLVIAALLILSTGRAFVFTIGAGYPNRPGVLGAVAMGAFAGSFALGAALHVLACLRPRHYYQLRWWRDLAFVISATSVLLAAGLVVWRQFAYGAY